MNFFDLNNPFSFLSYEEEIMTSNIKDAVEYLENNFGWVVEKEKFDSVLQLFEIDYWELPDFLKREFKDFLII